MKKKLFAGGLALLMLLGCVTVGLAGSQSDPLISLSYLTGTFFAELKANVTQWVAQDTQGFKAVTEQTSQDGWTVSSGFVSGTGEYSDTVTLTTGSGLIWTSGSGAVSSGVLVDVTSGTEIDTGKALTAGHRYLAAEDAVVVVSSRAQWMTEGKWLLGTGGTVTAPLPFTDVDPEEYYAAAVNWAVENQYTVGTSDTEFSPEETCTHIQILTFLWRAAGKPSAPQAPNTIDPGYHQDYHSAFNWAYEQGMIGNGFDPEADCTRADTVKYLWQADGSKTGFPVRGFIDVDAGADYAEAVNWAAANGITAGDDSPDTFNPTGTCTRGQIVTFLHRTYVPGVRV